jgi:hypothetical protein
MELPDGPPSPSVGSTTSREPLDNADEWARHAKVERARRWGGAVGGSVAIATGLLLLLAFLIDSGARPTIADDVVLAFLLGLGAIFLVSAVVPSRRGRWISSVEVTDAHLAVQRYDGTMRVIRWDDPEWEVSVARTVRPAEGARPRLEAGARLSLSGEPTVRSEPVTGEIGEAIARQAGALALTVVVEPEEKGSLDLPRVYERTTRIRPKSGGVPAAIAPAPNVVIPPTTRPRRAPPVV